MQLPTKQNSIFIILREQTKVNAEEEREKERKSVERERDDREIER